MKPRPADVLELSFQLGDLDPSTDDFVAGVFDLVGKLLPCDTTGRFAFDLADQSARLHSDPPEHSMASYSETFVACAPQHPTLIDLRERPADYGPRRLSDLTDPRRFRSTEMYREVYVPMGVRNNVSFLIRPLGSHPITAGWSFSRYNDFNDDELELAAWIQVVLAALEAMPAPAVAISDPHAEEEKVKLRLTPRELDVLSLLADGLTANAIARARRISPRTVHKHLQNAYAKLGVADRLMAVTRARALGLLKPDGDLAPPGPLIPR